jgi:hypothetical protein
MRERKYIEPPPVGGRRREHFPGKKITKEYPKKKKEKNVIYM